MTATLNVYGNAFEYDTDVDVYGVAFEWEEATTVTVGCMKAGQTYTPRATAAETYTPQMKQGQTYTPGATESQAGCC